MRLVCPNCGAQYEVPDEVIPEAGRDVQCSACGDTWFQHHPSHAPAIEADEAALAPEAAPVAASGHITEDTAGPKDTAEPEEAADPVHAEDAADDTAGDADTTPVRETAEADDGFDDFPAPAHDPDRDIIEDDEPEDAIIPPAVPARSRRLDPGVQNVLREEAEHEARRRAAEQQTGLESQPDLGLTQPSEDPKDRAETARRRMAQVKGETTPRATASPAAIEDAATAEATSRRDLLPDIEEINSTLRSKGERRAASTPAADADTAREQRRGFRIGFGLTLMVTALAIIVYVNADKLALRYPPVAPTLQSYQTNVNEGRRWLDTKVANLLAWLESDGA
ncbi:zinc-ribbon domain-containing protein [Maritimibacter alkaliphilus]|uniref:zinc-ribbon domain-containing protein n=1 Tax=Maritimibacter alkaliphilus TaxID=404236 RepID=UPI001C977AA8|nr:zinc-ribbon domain-containing protein [Maritimibacter alkaliphilus]MBY6091987.1 zinc-ribbon domain-containing protein [Maritimibacter alkaliphilus]